MIILIFFVVFFWGIAGNYKYSPKRLSVWGLKNTLISFFTVAISRTRGAFAGARVRAALFCRAGAGFGATDALFAAFIADYHKSNCAAYDESNNSYN